MKTCVYCVTNTVNGKMYVGVTRRSVAVRWREHCRDAVKRPVGALHKAVLKYGSQNFTIEALHTYATRREALAAECALIAALDLRTVGYNNTDGGDDPPSFAGKYRSPISGRLVTKTVREMLVEYEAHRLGCVVRRRANGPTLARTERPKPYWEYDNLNACTSVAKEGPLPVDEELRLAAL